MLATLFAINISILISNSNGIAKIRAISVDISEIKITTKPYIVAIPIIGAASKFASQNIVEIWLKFSSIIGIIKICADIVTTNALLINFVIELF